MCIRDRTEEGPKSVFGIVHRDDEGYSIKDDWNTLGMRATQSMTTLLPVSYTHLLALSPRRGPTHAHHLQEPT